ncbi:MAG: anthranilate phosphoribosyltransferase [Candidatus Peribacteraceae bacterium]|nr:anthranilate phosphoribosyltransferase [Candidatus Peribacteraceae bacterium]
MLDQFIEKLRGGGSLLKEEAAAAMKVIMEGKANFEELADYLVLLADKGETADEIAGSAEVMREHAIKIAPDREPLVDVCGTGGDESNTFNISTTVGFVVAGADVAVAKHGNRSVSSNSGSACVLTALGVEINLEPEQVERSIEEVGIGFLYAPNFHPAMRHAAPVRQKLKRRTIFNVLGPLTNPAGAQHQLVGVFSAELVTKIAEVLRKLEHNHAIVVHGDGLDELTTTGAENTVFELKNGDVEYLKVDPQSLGIPLAKPDDLLGKDADYNATITRAILDGQSGAPRNVVVLNAAAALKAADKVETIEDGIKLAEESIDSGAAKKKLEELVEFTQKI